MLIALLLVLGVDLVVIVAFVASVVVRKRWISRQPGAFRGAIRVGDGDLAGLGPSWSRGYGRWVRDVLVWNKGPFLFRTQLVPADGLAEERVARSGEITWLGDQPAVIVFVSGEAMIDVATAGDQVDLAPGSLRAVRRGGARANHPARVRLSATHRQEADDRPVITRRRGAAQMPITEYEQGSPFPGAVGRTVEESEPAWPAPRRAKDGAPNVLFFVLDDVGYGQLSCFGGLVETPNIDRVAAQRSAVREHAHDRALLAHPVEHPDGPQPSLQRRRLHHGTGHRLPRLRRADAVRERHASRDVAGARLQHLLPRQVASVPVGGQHAGRAVPSLAAGTRLRAVLRLPRW